ncbi:hypothetical protein BCR36DRAFT_580683 [Piromyces finnis]|uniref:Cyclin N-terminal domain-containing protein n=1 Tax=Piromyces finnis TaxID=1754191 RepID=A0A1Y1VIN0_9FUNG|nr:hypothetical protein BCR36DRAFT_580683 [Piromyces finnis]|eukprot:ORX57267.1 hypothetical protein BCR36DRAFT_580683 [Piromyces finnis]
MDALQLIRSYKTLNFIKNLKEKTNNIENVKYNKDYLANIEKTIHDEDILDDIVIALLNFIWPSEQEKIRSPSLKKFIKYVLKLSNATISIYISSIYYLLNLKDNKRYNNFLQRIQLEIENTKQEQGFINNGNIHERCCSLCGAYISCYKSETIVCKCRLFLTSLILASKFGQDKNYSNKVWSKISHFSVENINYNERFFLNLIEYKLYIGLETYQSFASLISNHIANVESQKRKNLQKLLNMSKISTDVNNTQEWKKYMEKKNLILKKLKQLEAIKQAKIKLMKRQTLESRNYDMPIQDNTQNLSPVEVNNNSSDDVQNTTMKNIQKLSPIDDQTGSYLKTEFINHNNITNKPTDIAAISPISPSDLHSKNINNFNTNTNVNYIPEKQDQNLSVFSLNYPMQEQKEVNRQQYIFTQMKQDKSKQLTIENFSSFMNFYNCINNKFSTSPELLIKSTDSYRILNYAITLACSKRANDALNILNHIIYGTMDICKEILSLALKGHVKTALIYIYLLTPNEIQYFNKNLKAPHLKILTPNDVLSVVSILLNCVQRKSIQNNEIKNDLLPNLCSQNQVNITSAQNILLTFINNINCSLSHN